MTSIVLYKAAEDVQNVIGIGLKDGLTLTLERLGELLPTVQPKRALSGRACGTPLVIDVERPLPGNLLGVREGLLRVGTESSRGTEAVVRVE